MSTTTDKLGLIKPELTDPADITALNVNWDKLDEEIGNLLNNEEAEEYLPLTGGTVTGTLVLSKVSDADGDSYNNPALVVGGEPTTYHLELDNNEIQAKQNKTTPGNLFLNSNGGKVTVGEGGLETNGHFWPVTPLLSNVGTPELPWNRVAGRYYEVYGAANVLYGRLRVATTGTEATDGVTTLVLGNEIPSGTANNASAKITMYGSGTAFTNILPSTATSGSNSVTLPVSTGTMTVINSSNRFTTTVSAGTSYQDTGTSLLRNSRLLSTETTPTVNGEICWLYE